MVGYNNNKKCRKHQKWSKTSKVVKNNRPKQLTTKLVVENIKSGQKQSFQNNGQHHRGVWTIATTTTSRTCLGRHVDGDAAGQRNVVDVGHGCLAIGRTKGDAVGGGQSIARQGQLRDHVQPHLCWTAGVKGDHRHRIAVPTQGVGARP
jgi:hypothetical protein